MTDTTKPDTTESVADDDNMDGAVTITETEGEVSIDISLHTTIRIPRSLINESSGTEVLGIGAMVAERIECDMQIDREGNTGLVASIDKKLAEHLKANPVSPL